MTYNHLKRTVQSFIRAETLQEAYQVIEDASAELPLFSRFNVEPDTTHSSSTGQKNTSRFDTFNARHSSKYFGLGKGVTLNTMVANRIPVNAKIKGANEHESHYVFDLIYHNPTSIQPQIHSTDTHSSNRVNFAVLDFFGYRSAPRYKHFPKEAAKIVGFKNLNRYIDTLRLFRCFTFLSLY